MKPRLLHAPILAGVLGWAPAVLASPQGTIGLFLIPEGSDQVDFGTCQGNSHPIDGIDRIQVSVQAQLAGPTLQGISSAVLFVEGLEGLPQGSVHVVAAANPGAVVTIGNPVLPMPLEDGTPARRAALAWASDPPMQDCQTGTLVEDSRYVELYNLILFSVGQALPHDLVLRVVAGEPAAFPGLECPTVTLCDYPAFTAVCVTGGEFIVNPVQRSCTVTRGTTAVEKATWGKMKSLYRDAVR